MTYQEIYKVLDPLLAEHKLEEAINWTEAELKKMPPTDFHKIIGKNLNHLIPSLINWIDNFHERISKNITIKSIYCEMNGFTINPDLWFIDLFAFDKYLGLKDLEWVSDWEDQNSTMSDSFIVTGFEDLQKKYEEDDRTDEEGQASVFCEFLIVLRLQELFMNATNKAKQGNHLWTKIPIIVTAHDWELIYQTT